MNRRTVLATIAGLFGLMFGSKAVAKAAKDVQPIATFHTFTYNADDYVFVPINKESGKPPRILIWHEEKQRYVTPVVDENMFPYYRNLEPIDPETHKQLLSGKWSISR